MSIKVKNSNGTKTLMETTDPASKLTVTRANPTSATWYYILGATDSSGDLEVKANSDSKISNLYGSESTAGYCAMLLGNDTATGTEGNRRGWIRLYSDSSGYVNLYPPTTTGSYSISLPAKTGTLALKSDLPAYTSASITVNSGNTAIDSIGTTAYKYTAANLVYISFGVSKSSGSYSVGNTVLGTIPAGYRPSTEFNTACRFGDYTTNLISISTEGVITLINLNTASYSTVKLTCCYPII